MLSTSLSAISLLLATTILLVRACPLNLTDNCQDECIAYKNSKDMTMPSQFDITATLASLTNNVKYFQTLNGNLRLEANVYPGQNDDVKACYARENPTTGCTEDQIVDGGIIREGCTWTYKCNYDQNRVPQYLWEAVCNSNTAETIYYPVPVLKYHVCNPLDGSSKWTLAIENVPVSCACKSTTTTM